MLRQQRTANRQRPRHVVRTLPRGGFGRAGVRELRAQALQVAHRCVDALVVGRQQVEAFVQARLGAAHGGKVVLVFQPVVAVQVAQVGVQHRQRLLAKADPVHGLVLPLLRQRFKLALAVAQAGVHVQPHADRAVRGLRGPAFARQELQKIEQIGAQARGVVGGVLGC